MFWTVFRLISNGYVIHGQAYVLNEDCFQIVVSLSVHLCCMKGQLGLLCLQLLAHFNSQTDFRFYGSSLFLVYEGDR